MQRLLVHFGRDLEPERWIFIVGCYNSGTTLLDAIIQAHPEVVGLPAEGVALSDALPRPEELGWPRMWHKCLDRVRLEADGDSDECAQHARRQWSLWVPASGRNIVEKSIANTTRMPFLQSTFPNAYFIHIVRNGYAVAEGIRRKGKPERWKNPVYRDQYPIELCAQQWVESERLVRKDRESIRRFYSLRYEDLTSRPEEELAKISDFLEIPPFSSKVFQRKWDVQSMNATIVNMNHRNLRGLSDEDLDHIEEIAENELRQNGYYRSR